MNTTSFMETTVFQMISVISEVERKLISQRVNDVMTYMKQSGTLRTKPIFGYKIELNHENKKVVMLNEKEQEVINFIKQLVKQYPKIRICDIIRQLKNNNTTLRNGKLYHEGIRTILKRENIYK